MERQLLVRMEPYFYQKGNQALSFDNKIEHQGFTQTVTQRRIVLNIATSNLRLNN